MFADARRPFGRPRRSGALCATAVAVLAVGVTAPPVSAGGSATSGPAAETGLRCGDDITESTKLTADLLDCPGNGLVIAASGVTLDLAGHVVDGDGTGNGDGIVSLGNDRVEIKNGTVRQFGTGVSLTRNSRAPSVSAESLPTNHLVRRLAVVGNTEGGISTFDGQSNVLKGNSVARNGGFGVSIRGGARNTLERNAVVGNRSGGILLASGSRLSGAQQNLVRGNDVVANQGSGIVLGDSLLAPSAISDNRVERNDVVANQEDGIRIAGGGGSFEDNRTDRNGDDGIDAECRSRLVGPSNLPACFLDIALTGNSARRNGDLGVEADPGVVDGGGNDARRNGNQSQCAGVRCSS